MRPYYALRLVIHALFACTDDAVGTDCASSTRVTDKDEWTLFCRRLARLLLLIYKLTVSRCLNCCRTTKLVFS